VESVQEENRTARKRWAIIEAATEAFLRGGYRGTSMDEIAAAAGVSKQTVYKQFSDKQRLFVEIVTGTVGEVADPVHDEVRDLRETGDLPADLRDLARRQLTTVLQPRVLRLRRLVIAEAARFPELGRVFYEQGPGRTIAALAATFERLAERGLLHVPDPLLAADQFNWLIMSAPLNRAMLLGIDGAPDPAEIDRWADDGVRTFLAAHHRQA
jgi:TetR/AcrR family transcriptional regulator, mexJK operon transcriptional repressor